MGNGPKRAVCVNCGEPVTLGPGRAWGRSHSGHVDIKLDYSCGTWGWRWAAAEPEYNDAPHMR